MKTPYALCSLKRHWQIVLFLFWIPKQLLIITSLSSVLRSTTQNKAQRNPQKTTGKRGTEQRKINKLTWKIWVKSSFLLDWCGTTENLCAFSHSTTSHTFTQSSAVPHIGNHPWQRLNYIRKLLWWRLQTAFTVSNMQQPSLNNFKTSIPRLLHHFSVRSLRSR